METTLQSKSEDVGVIIGRFMVDELHSEHRKLINFVVQRHARVLVFLGITRTRNEPENPLDFRSRKQMFLEEYPNIDVFPLEDKKDNHDWSRYLDGEIRQWINPNESALLYGGRDSFLNTYFGHFKTQELLADTIISATEVRRKICNFYVPTKDYRAGMIAATGQRHPHIYTTVDAAIFNEDESEILLGRKANEKNWRFIGGFSSTNSSSFEDDCKREVQEETGLEVSEPEYLGSTLIDDWRYKGVNKIKTLFFKVRKVFGGARANDDIREVKWFKVGDLKKEMLEKEHWVLLEILKKNI